MPVSPHFHLELIFGLKRARDISLNATLLLKTSTLLLASIMTLAEANRLFSERFILQASGCLKGFLNASTSSLRVDLPELVQLVDLGREVVRSLTESSVSLAKLSGGKRLNFWSNETTHDNSLNELDAAFRDVFAQLSFIEANLDPKHFDDIRNSVLLVRDQHDLNSKVAFETLGALDEMLGRSILLLRSVESILDRVG